MDYFYSIYQTSLCIFKLDEEEVHRKTNKRDWYCYITTRTTVINNILWKNAGCYWKPVQSTRTVDANWCRLQLYYRWKRWQLKCKHNGNNQYLINDCSMLPSHAQRTQIVDTKACRLYSSFEDYIGEDFILKINRMTLSWSCAKLMLNIIRISQ